jgi:hypothetical protein
MKSTFIFAAGISRTIARIDSILVILLGIPFLLFVGLQLLSGESGSLTILLYLLLLVSLLVGLAVSWWKEGLGAAITLASLIGSFVLSGGILPGVGSRQGGTLLAGPLNLLFALLLPGYSPDVSSSARLVPVASWVLSIVPVMFFFASWLLRKHPGLKSSEGVIAEGEESEEY